MTDKQPEPEYYLITPNELFLFGVDGAWDREERTQLYDVVKSRPYHPAPEHHEKFVTDAITFACEKHDEAIRQSEREKVLDELIKEIKIHGFSTGHMPKPFEYVFKWVESLRKVE